MQRFKKVVGFDDTWFMIVGIVIAATLIPIFSFNKHPLENWNNYFLSGVLITLVYTSVVWVICRYIIGRVWQKFPMPAFVMKNVLFQLVVISFTCIVISFIGVNIEIIFHKEYAYAKLLNNNTKTTLVVTTIVTTIYNCFYLFNLLKKSIHEKERLEKENVQSQLEILKNQVKPHFLFNSLNTLASIIPDDPDLAVDYVQKLSKVYRYILEIKDKKLIPLSEEINCITAYLFMLKIRFGDNLIVNIKDDNFVAQDHIVPLSLQLLVENAVKHNIISSKKPLHINIYKEKKGQLIVKNNLQKKEQIMPSTGTGLNNIRSRYEILSNDAVEVLTTQNEFIVTLPLISILTN